VIYNAPSSGADIPLPHTYANLHTNCLLLASRAVGTAASCRPSNAGTAARHDRDGGGALPQGKGLGLTARSEHSTVPTEGPTSHAGPRRTVVINGANNSGADTLLPHIHANLHTNRPFPASRAPRAAAASRAGNASSSAGSFRNKLDGLPKIKGMGLAARPVHTLAHTEDQTSHAGPRGLAAPL
jgi:hypothetical protein